MSALITSVPVDPAIKVIKELLEKDPTFKESTVLSVEDITLPIRVLSQKHVLFIPRPVLWTGQGCFKRQQNAKPTSNKKLRILAASLALQQVKEVGAVTTQEEVTTECNIQIYIILALTVTIFGIVMIAVLHSRKLKLCRGHMFLWFGYGWCIQGTGWLGGNWQGCCGGGSCVCCQHKCQFQGRHCCLG